EKLNPEKKPIWVVVGGQEISELFRKEMKRYQKHVFGFGSAVIAAAEGCIQSGHPSVATLSYDEASPKAIDPKYHYLFVIPINQVEKILTEDKCIIVSGKIKINVERQVLDDKGEWTIVSETEGESYVTLIAAPNKRSLKKAITRFFTLTEIPLDPIIWKPK
ncbi:unnamed protein product, partial [marine sediment metagenome]